MLKYQKYVNALFIAAAAIVWFVTRHYTSETISYFQLNRALGVGATEIIIHALPILLGVLTFVLLRRNTASYNFVSDSVSELVSMSWPNQKDVQIGTVVVIATVIIAGVILGVLDLGLTALVKFFIGA